MAFRKGEGGRPKGARNRRTAELQAAVEAGGITPLDFLLQVMRDPQNDLDKRIDAAKAAAEFVTPKLARIEHEPGERMEDLMREIAGVVDGDPLSLMNGHALADAAREAT